MFHDTIKHPSSHPPALEFVITDIAEADIGKLAFFVGSLGGNMQVRATDAKHKKTAAAPKKRPAEETKAPVHPDPARVVVAAPKPKKVAVAAE